MKKKPGPLKIVCIVGLALLLIISWGLVFFTLSKGNPLLRPEESFSRSLREYDNFNAPGHVLAGENPELVERQLSILQRQVQTIDEQLSVLKRRRALAMIDRNYIPAYRIAAHDALETFPFSSPLAALAAEAAIFDQSPLIPETQALLRNYSSRISQYHLGFLELSMHILAGNLDDPSHAAALSWLPHLLSMDFSGLPAETQRVLQINNFLLRTQQGDINGASLILNSLLSGLAQEHDDNNIRRMAAEFFYDHGMPMRAAELFINLGGDRDIARAADAFVLAGEIPAARNIWLALSRGHIERSRLNSYYNLASTARDNTEELLWIERIFTERVLSGRVQGEHAIQDSIGTYSIIRYTRLLDLQRSIAILTEFKNNPLLDHELLLRNIESWHPTRIVSEIWQLLNRHIESEELYEWAAWYFVYQRHFSEIDILLRNAERHGMSGNWILLHRGLALIREGRITEAERLFMDAVDRQGWQFYANLGLIQENRRDIPAALEFYQSAAALVRDRPQAAQLQLRISHCFNALGRNAEGRRALELAYELDPDDINIRREFMRLRN